MKNIEIQLAKFEVKMNSLWCFEVESQRWSISDFVQGTYIYNLDTYLYVRNHLKKIMVHGKCTRWIFNELFNFYATSGLHFGCHHHQRAPP